MQHESQGSKTHSTVKTYSMTCKICSNPSLLKASDFLKEGAKLTAHKLTKKELRRFEKLMDKADKERAARNHIDWDSLNKPMTI